MFCTKIFFFSHKLCVKFRKPIATNIRFGIGSCKDYFMNTLYQRQILLTSITHSVHATYLKIFISDCRFFYKITFWFSTILISRKTLWNKHKTQMIYFPTMIGWISSASRTPEKDMVLSSLLPWTSFPLLSETHTASPCESLTRAVLLPWWSSLSKWLSATAPSWHRKKFIIKFFFRQSRSMLIMNSTFGI